MVSCADQDFEGVRGKTGEDSGICGRLSGSSAFSTGAQRKGSDGVPFYICTEGQRLCADMDHLSWIFSGRNGWTDGDAAPGLGLYCGRYAAGSGSAGDHRVDVQECVRQYFYRGISDAVTVCDERDQFLFRSVGESGRCGSESFLAPKKIKYLLYGRKNHAEGI